MGAWVRVGAVWENGRNIAKINGPRIFMSEGREDVDITGFEGDIVISLSIVGRSVIIGLKIENKYQWFSSSSERFYPKQGLFNATQI